MGLLPLEFTDGLTDSPYFRETLQSHERELDRTNSAIKHMIKDIRDLIIAARNLSRAQRNLSETLNNFNFECIGNSQTDDEMVIANSFKDFARLLSTIEDERDRLLEKADEAFLEPIERFRRDQIGSAKDAKKKFDKETQKYCQSLERYLNTSIKKGENQLLEVDANHSIEQWHFFQAMSEYVLKLQEVNERKKFEFVETVLSFMLGWLTFYHQGHEIATDFYSVKMELQMRLQRTRNNFNMTQEETKCLRQKMMNCKENFKQKYQDSGAFNKMYTRQGYLFLMEKKAFSTSWTKHFCQYEKNSHRLTLIQYTQTMGKILTTEEVIIKECIRRPTDSIDRRFCFDILSCIDDNNSKSMNYPGSGTPNGSAGYSSGSASNGSAESGPCTIYTFQALSEEDYKLWLDALDGRDPVPVSMNISAKGGKFPNPKSENGPKADYSDSFELDEEGYCFVRKCIRSIEEKGLDHKGIYRMVGVTSKVRGLMELFSDKRALSIAKRKGSTSNDSNGSSTNSGDEQDLFELNLGSDEYETKTITSALKGYLRNLSEPIMTFQLHCSFISAAKLENRELRITRIHTLVHRLPPLNFKVLRCLIDHLVRIAKLSDKNLMTASNLGVCFGPTLLRTAEESVAAILDIKFVNVIAELLIENYDKIFLTKPIEEVSPNATTTRMVSKVLPQPNSAKGHHENLIQQRPLPHVPSPLMSYNHHANGQLYSQSSPNSDQLNHSPQMKSGTPTTTVTSNSVFFTGSPQQPPSTYRYGTNLMPVTTARNMVTRDSLDAIYGTTGHMHRQMQLFPPQQTTVRRSSSQDQLYTVISGGIHQQRLGRSVLQQAVPLSHMQHFQQQQRNANLGFSTYPQMPLQQQHSPRKMPVQLSNSIPSPSASSVSTQPGSGGYLNAQQQQSQSQHIYQSPMLLKNAAVASTSSSIYGHLRSSQHQSLQPSVSYQNLHCNAEIVAATNEMNLGGGSSGPHGYTRPMTSIGILPLHSTIAPLNRPDGLGGLVMSPSQLALHQAQPQSVGAPPPTTTRQLTLSSTSSTSLPSTPEHSTQPSQFAYHHHLQHHRSANNATVQPSNRLSPEQTLKQTSITPPPSMTLSSVDGSVGGGGGSAYSAIYHPPVHAHQPQPLYGSIGHRPTLAVSGDTQPSSTQGGPQTATVLPTTKVRTRYVCIGGSDSELSFQPNMIITNVRSTREPGWLEGNLNGKTGLIPSNYVEFI